MGYFKKKIILTVLGILILIALFSCVSYFTFALSFGKKQQKTNAADLTISTLAELQTFAAAVNGGNTYSGKTVVLGADIDCGGATITINAFSGTFDGNWKTISNMVVNGQYMETYLGKQSVKYYYYNVGFIGKLDGTVKNLRLSDISCTVPDKSKSYEYIGGVAGFATDNSIITQCCVENFTTSGGQTSGILATGNATISNCYTENIVTSTSYSGGIGPCTISWTVPGAGSKEKSKTTVITNCVAVNNFKYPISAVANIINCYSAANQTYDLDLASIWYYNSSFNGGFPYLRKFMTEFEFDIDSNGSYDVSLPVKNGDVSAVENIINTAISNKSKDLLLSSYGGTVSAAVVPGKQFDVWSKTDEAYHYQANYTIIEYDLVFNDCDFVTIKINNEVVESASFKVCYNTLVLVILTQFSENNGKYSMILFDFYDSRYNRQSVKFEVDNQHYLAGYDIGSGTQTDRSITLAEGGEISLIAELRTYIPKYE